MGMKIWARRHRGDSRSGMSPAALDSNAIADGFNEIADEVRLIAVRSNGEMAARMVYDQRLRDRALTLFDQAAELGYPVAADRSNLENPPLLVPSGLLVGLLSRLEQFARSRPSAA